MMKWETRTETRNIGVLELGSLTLDEDYMEVSIDICDMSDSLKEEIKRGIEIEKVRYSTEIQERLDKGISMHPLKCNTVWSSKPVEMDFTYLRVKLEAGKPISYSIKFGFHDADDEAMEAWDGNITVDLSAYTQELKKAIIKVLIDKFF